MKKPNIRHYEALVFAYREGSLAAAAKRLGISQPAVSQHLSSLEQMVGAKIFLRDREGITLTRSGQSIFDLANRIVDINQHLGERITRQSQMNSGELTVVANAPRPSLQLLAKFQEKFPRIDVRFSLHSWTETIALANQRRADIAIITDPRKAPGLLEISLGKLRYKAIMRHDHAYAEKSSFSLQYLKKERLIITSEGSLTRRLVSSKLESLDIKPRQYLEVPHYPIMKDAVLHGLGIGIFLEDSSFPTANIVERPIDEMPELHENKMVIPRDKFDLNIIQSFISVADP
ncbi:MAG: LysR family transcriptional regulator [Alphaproteobacteria bacterium]